MPSIALLAEEVVTPAGGMESITSAVPTVTSMVGSVFDVMTGNPLLCVFLAGSLIGLGFTIFKKAKRASH